MKNYLEKIEAVNNNYRKVKEKNIVTTGGRVKLPNLEVGKLLKLKNFKCTQGRRRLCSDLCGVSNIVANR